MNITRVTVNGHPGIVVGRRTAKSGDTTCVLWDDMPHGRSRMDWVPSGDVMVSVKLDRV